VKKPKKILSELCGGKNHSFYGKHLTVEHKQNISKTRMGDKHWYYGKRLSDEHKRNISKSQKLTINNTGRFKIKNKFNEDVNKRRIDSIKKFYNTDVGRKLASDRIKNIYKNMSEEKRQQHRDNIKKSWILRKLKKGGNSL
jgi:hypothetical protein